MKNIFTYLMCLLAAVAVIGCSKADEPDSYDSTYDGVSILMNAEITLYKDDKPAFTPSDDEGVYLAVASGQEKARSFIVELIENPKWDGKDVTIKLGEKGEDGTLTIIGGTPALLSQGIYNKIYVDIKSYPPYTLEIITEESSENGKGKDIIVLP